PVADDSCSGAIVLVGDLADQLLDEVFEGDETRSPAVFVDDDGELVTASTELGDQGVDVHRHGCEQGLGRQSTYGDVDPAITRLRDGRRDVHAARDVVEIVVEDREASVAAPSRELDDVVHRVARGDRVHA